MNDERDLLAAEYTLRLLSGAELDDARRHAAGDADFAAAVAQWEERLQPLAEALPAEQPSAAVWAGIERAAATAPGAANDNDAAQLARRLTRWRLYGTGITALAASLAVALTLDVLRDAPAAPDAPKAQAGQPPQLLTASLAAEGAPNAASVNYEPGSSSLFVLPVRWPEDPAHDHVLWIIPPGGEPVKVGPCCQSGPERHSIPQALAPHFRARSDIAVSVEPRGAAPDAKPSSAFVVRGELRPI